MYSSDIKKLTKFMKILSPHNFSYLRKKNGSNMDYFNVVNGFKLKGDYSFLILNDHFDIPVKLSDDRFLIESSIKGNQLSRRIDDLNDFTSFLDTLPWFKKKNFLFGNRELAENKHKKISISRYVAKDLNVFDSITFGEEEMTFLYKTYHYDELLLTASIKSVGNFCVDLKTYLLDNKLVNIDYSVPKEKRLSKEEQLKKSQGTYRRGLKTYFKEVQKDVELKNVAKKINDFFYKAIDISNSLRNEAGVENPDYSNLI